MVVDSTQNTVNPHMHYGAKNIVGVIDTPKLAPRESYYTKTLSEQTRKQANQDVYRKLNKAPIPKKGEGIPKIIKIGAGIIATLSLLLFGKSIGKGLLKFIKNLPK